MDHWSKQLGLPRAAENSKERQAPPEEGTPATERNLGSARAYSQDNNHRPTPFSGQDFSTLILSSATRQLWDPGTASAEQHASDPICKARGGTRS